MLNCQFFVWTVILCYPEASLVLYIASVTDRSRDLSVHKVAVGYRCLVAGATAKTVGILHSEEITFEIFWSYMHQCAPRLHTTACYKWYGCPQPPHTIRLVGTHEGCMVHPLRGRGGTILIVKCSRSVSFWVGNTNIGTLVGLQGPILQRRWRPHFWSGDVRRPHFSGPMGTEVGGACLQVAPPAGGLQQLQPEWDRVVTKAPWRCEPQVLNRERSRCVPMLNASLASSRRPVRSSCSTRSVQLQWRHLKGGATWHAPPPPTTALWFSCGSKLAKNWNFDYSGKTFTYDF